jgi:hypothetical protein
MRVRVEGEGVARCEHELQLRQWENRMWSTVYERAAWHHDIGKHDGTDLPFMFCPRCEMEHPEGRYRQALALLQQVADDGKIRWDRPSLAKDIDQFLNPGKSLAERLEM